MAATRAGRQTTTPNEAHHIHSKRLMKHAFEQLEKGDRLQASEKAWGATAHALKSIAKERGMRYGRHEDVWALVRRLVADAKDSPEAMGRGIEIANRLHQNFYNDVEQPGELEAALPLVQRSIDLLFTNHHRWKRDNPHWRQHVGRPDIGRRARSTTELPRQSEPMKKRSGNPLRRRRF